MGAHSGLERWEMDKPGCLIFLEPVVQVEKEDAWGGGVNGNP